MARRAAEAEEAATNPDRQGGVPNPNCEPRTSVSGPPSPLRLQRSAPPIGFHLKPAPLALHVTNLAQALPPTPAP